jgi:hypothetical protein
MKPPLPRTLSAVPQTLHVRLEIAKAIRTLAGPDEDELLRQRRAEIAAIRRDFELLAADIRKAFEEAGTLAKAELRAAQRKYSPDQPRVPAGNPDGGEWTSGSKSPSDPSGVARDGPEPPKRYAALITDVITDAPSGPRPDPRYAAAAEEGAEEDENESESASRANRDRLRRPTREQQQRLDDANARLQAAISQVRTLDPNWRPTPGLYSRSSIENDILELESEIREAQARYWQLTEARGSRPGSSGYPIDLLEEDARVYGSHIFERHVGKSPDYLFRRLQTEDIPAAGSFTSVEAANKLINATVAAKSELVNAVVRGDIAGTTLYKNFNSPTGYEAVRSEAELQDTYGVSVVIARNPYLVRGFRVITAFPGNEKSR